MHKAHFCYTPGESDTGFENDIPLSKMIMYDWKDSEGSLNKDDIHLTEIKRGLQAR